MTNEINKTIGHGQIKSSINFEIGEGWFTAYWGAMGELVQSPVGPGRYLLVDRFPLIELKTDEPLNWGDKSWQVDSKEAWLKTTRKEQSE